MDESSKSNWTDNLKIGDIVGKSTTWSHYCVPVKVDRLTQKYVICDKEKYRKDDGYAVGRACGYIVEWNGMIEKQYNREVRKQKALQILRKTSFSNLPLEKLEKLVEILKE